MTLSEKTRDRLTVATFLGVLFIIVYLTGSPSYGTQTQDIVKKVSHPEYGDIQSVESMPKSEITCVGNVKYEGYKLHDGTQIVHWLYFEDDSAECAYPSEKTDFYLELYGKRLVI